MCSCEMLLDCPHVATRVVWVCQMDANQVTRLSCRLIGINKFRLDHFNPF